MWGSEVVHCVLCTVVRTTRGCSSPSPPLPVLAPSQARDPIPQFAKFMVANGLATEADIKAIEKKVQEEVEDCVEYADAAPKPVSSRWLHSWVGLEGGLRSEGQERTAWSTRTPPPSRCAG